MQAMNRWLGLACGALVLAGCENTDENAVQTWKLPQEIVSSNGELRTTFTVTDTTVQVAGKSLRTLAYNGVFMPPLLRVKPGDTIYLNLNNQTSEPTNEHYHGLNVSPRINPDATVSDNVLIQAEPGTQVNYKIEIPEFHRPGLYWYHAHLHGLAERQVMGGLSGGLVVEGILDPFPELQGVPERVMLLKDVQITPQGTLPDDIDPGGDTNRTINGLSMPTMLIHEGELQFWRFANIGADMYYNLVLDGHVFYEFARDGNRHNQLVEMTEILLPPGARSEVFVRGGKPGRYTLRTLDVQTGPDGDDYKASPLGTLVSQVAREPGRALPANFPPVEDFRTVPVANRRSIIFSEDPVNNIFYMDSGAGPNVYDPNRVDSTINVGTMEEWTVYNATAELHVFHIHQTDFQVLEVNGVPQPFIGYQDSVNVSYQPEGGPPGSVKFLIDFRNPDIVGKFVYHCHILEHEDGGMMSIAEVVGPIPPNSSGAPYAAGALPARREVISNTLEAFQAGSFCKTPPLPGRAFGDPSVYSTAFRIERQVVPAGF